MIKLFILLTLQGSETPERNLKLMKQSLSLHHGTPSTSQNIEICATRFVKVKDEHIDITTALGVEKTIKSHSNVGRSIHRIFGCKDRSFVERIERLVED